MIALITSFILFSIGVFGVLSRKDLLRILISVSIMLGSITLLLVTLSTATTASTNYSLILFVWAVEVAEIILALALFLSSKGHAEQLKW
jgi:NADH-quinone oxidoreductase subunit K